ncbi:single-stranded DNA-binding protein [bacterium]|nr:single-stranded DNA-binding protein [bacterium]
MASSFEQMKRGRKSDFDKLAKAVEKLNEKQGGGGADTRFWQPGVDQAGNGFAVIRFLPAPAGEDNPFVRVFSHGFKGPGGWLIDNCPTTLNEKCPVCEENTVLWNSGVDANKKIVSERKRKLNFISNIYVVRDPSNPSNEGKVFLFKYGKKIYDKINNAMYPEFEDEKAVNPFDMWEGADFKLKIRKVEGYRNYDKSEFDAPAALLEDDEKLEKIWQSEHSLAQFVDKKEFKNYEELKDRLNKALGNASAGSHSRAIEEDMEEDAPVYRPKAAPAKQEKEAWNEADEVFTSSDSEDDLPNFFKKLAED